MTAVWFFGPSREEVTLFTVVFLLTTFVIMHHLLYPVVVKRYLEDTYKGKHKNSTRETLVRQRDFSEVTEFWISFCQLSIKSLTAVKIWNHTIERVS